MRDTFLAHGTTHNSGRLSGRCVALFQQRITKWEISRTWPPSRSRIARCVGKNRDRLAFAGYPRTTTHPRKRPSRFILSNVMSEGIVPAVADSFSVLHTQARPGVVDASCVPSVNTPEVSIAKPHPNGKGRRRPSTSQSFGGDQPGLPAALAAWEGEKRRTNRQTQLSARPQPNQNPLHSALSRRKFLSRETSIRPTSNM